MLPWLVRKTETERWSIRDAKDILVADVKMKIAQRGHVLVKQVLVMVAKGVTI